MTWYKDEQPIYIDFEKYQMTESGDLIVLDVDLQAAGNYTCRATNMAGFKETPKANVWVYGKYRIIIKKRPLKRNSIYLESQEYPHSPLVKMTRIWKQFCNTGMHINTTQFCDTYV